VQFDELIHLEPHGADTFVGSGPRYPWGGLYGGQIVAQALHAAAATVDEGFAPHSLRAYFIRAGDHTEPVRYEVDRTRNGRSFCTRRVVARQAVGAILNLEASFHVAEATDEVQLAAMPDVPGPDAFEETSWSSAFERRMAPRELDAPVASWFRMPAGTGGDDPLVHAAGLAYISDDLPTDAVARVVGADFEDGQGWFSVSLDHAVWFHHPLRVDEWHLETFTCQGFANGRGLALGNVFTPDGTHAATIAQEVLIRKRRH
jgi:acyl-CoA thioesterase-2